MFTSRYRFAAGLIPARAPRRLPCAVVILAALGPLGAAAQDFADLSIEALMQIEITSVARKPQSLSDAPAAIYVITAEDIRRSGLTSIPELLRRVPGIQVARINGTNWAVTSRGFNGEFSNKLLVMIDGRSVYTPLFSGVEWDVQNPFLADIDRIEVIRGPGGSLWGANAVNGVINIITRNAADSVGTLVEGRLDDQGSSLATARIGGALGEHGHGRVYLQTRDFAGQDTASGGDAFDGYRELRAGFRTDWELSTSDSFTLQGDVYDADADLRGFVTSLSPPDSGFFDEIESLQGSNLLARLDRSRADGSGVTLSAYFDHVERRRTILDERIDTVDVEYRQRLPLGRRQDLSWGLGYRRIADSLRGSFTLSFWPETRTTELYSAYVHDEVTLSDGLELTVGTKLEYNDYTGFEVQPNIRLMWEPGPRNRVWGAVSRAVRTPARANDDVRINAAVVPGTPLPTLVSVFGSRDFDSEVVHAYELGFRSLLSDVASVEVAAFYNRFDRLFTTEAIPPGLEPAVPPRLLIASVFDNRGAADTYGIEINANWQVDPRWRTSVGYAYFDGDYGVSADSTDANGLADAAQSSPRHQAQLQSYLTLTNKLQIDAAWYWVDELGGLGIDAYSRLDVRLGWQATDRVELSISGQNLTDSRHGEFTSLETATSLVPRTAALDLRIRF